ncbi:hypothetical protein CANARDRAFT_26104 [[Candida] arabinofermentans NRRL YB-2248]|uniref:VASt domain-containing protein n=1 Tax=[Candida] arabinofermentans NRRL YB-2248 TaxID=983967 RepID=A0A1E4T842_9ASCO|nr:hypothetical protein CANARDRAFT_26104 [[Candida] arabinofermentans NRRL YB-2248]
MDLPSSDIKPGTAMELNYNDIFDAQELNDENDFVSPLKDSLARKTTADSDDALPKINSAPSQKYPTPSFIQPPSPTLAASQRRRSATIPRLPDDENDDITTNVAPQIMSPMNISNIATKNSTATSLLSTSESSSTKSGGSISSTPMNISFSSLADPETTKTDAHSVIYGDGPKEAHSLDTLEATLSKTMENDKHLQEDDSSSSLTLDTSGSGGTPTSTNLLMTSFKNLAAKHARNYSDASFDSINTLGSPINTSKSIKEEDDEDSRDDAAMRGIVHEIVKADGTTEMLSYRRSRRNKSSSISSIPKSPISASDQPTSAEFPDLTASPTASRLSSDFNSAYVDEKYLDTQYRYASLKRNLDFHELFKAIPQDDRLLDDFSCALSREILLQGRLYVSEHYICFNSSILGWVTNLVMPHDEVSHFEKKSTAGLFPNGIIVETKDSKHSFASFVSRDSTLNFLETVWSRSITLSRARNEKSRDLDIFVSNLSSSSSNLSEADIYTIDESEPDGGSRSLNGGISTTIEKPPYELLGPSKHAPTSHDWDPEANGETEILDVTLEGPLGLIYNIMFGEKIEFHKHVMELNGGYDFTEYGPFTENSETKKIARSFEYEKKLNYSMGPKSTHVLASEVLEHKDFEGYVELISTTKTPNVPSGNVFEVMTRYLLTWAENNQTHLLVSYKINWSGSSWIKGMIEKSTKAGQLEYVASLKDELLKTIPKCTVVSDSQEGLAASATTLSGPNVSTKETKESLSPPKVVNLEASNDYGALLEPIMDNWQGILIFVILLIQFITIYKLNVTKKLLMECIHKQDTMMVLLLKEKLEEEGL